MRREPEPSPDGWRGLFLIAALGPISPRYARTSATLRDHFEGWDCVALAWSAAVTTSNDPGAVFIRRRCRVILRVGMRWGSLQNLTTPEMVRPYDYVMIVLDDLIVPPSFNATRFVEDARRHNLSKAAPTVWGIQTHAGPVAAFQSIGTSYEHVAYAQRSCATAGGSCSVRLTTWVETFMTLYTRAAWECHWTMFDDSILHDDAKAIGYGYDRCFKLHCGAQHQRQGVLLDYAVTHMPGASTAAADHPPGLEGSGGNSSGRRLASTGLEIWHYKRAQIVQAYKRAQLQAYALEKALRDAHGTVGNCETRHAACGKQLACDIERADLSVEAHPEMRRWKPGLDAYPSCWHSCCCYDARAGRVVPKGQWTLSNSALQATLRASQPVHGKSNRG